MAGGRVRVTMLSTGVFVLDVVLLVLLPTVLGLWLSVKLGDWARNRKAKPLTVRMIRIVVGSAGIGVALWGATIAFGPLSLLSTLTVSAIATITISLALQTTLSNIIAGFVLLRTRFLRVGDTVQFSGIKGTIVGLGLIEVVIRTEAGTLAVVSNANLLSGPMLNFTATTRLAGDY